MSEPDVVEGSLRERQRLQVRADIQRAASRLFAEHGFDAVTTEAVASAARVSRSTFFRHVRHKEDRCSAPCARRGRRSGPPWRDEELSALHAIIERALRATTREWS